MDHIKFRIILFIWVWIFYLGFLISGGLDPQKSASLQCTISIGTTNLLENVSCRPCAGHLKFRRFGSGSAHARNFWNVSRRQSSLNNLTCMGLLLAACRSVVLYMTGVMLHYGTFRYYRKQSLYVLPACSYRGQLNP